MLPSGSGQARLVRSVTRIWPRCGRTGALSPNSGASAALPRPAASTIFGAPIVSPPASIRKSPGAASARVIVQFGR